MLKFTLDFRDLILKSTLLFKITGTHGNGIPIGGDINPKQNKFILLDIGAHIRIIPLYMIGEYDRILRAAGEGEDGI